jgi:hypothetical protein
MGGSSMVLLRELMEDGGVMAETDTDTDAMADGRWTMVAGRNRQ